MTLGKIKMIGKAERSTEIRAAEFTSKAFLRITAD